MNAVHEYRRGSTRRLAAIFAALMLVAVLASGAGGYLIRMATAPRVATTVRVAAAVASQPGGLWHGDAWYNEQPASAAGNASAPHSVTQGDAWYNEQPASVAGNTSASRGDNWWNDEK